MALGSDQTLNIIIKAKDEASKAIAGVKNSIGDLNKGFAGAQQYSKAFVMGIGAAGLAVGAFGVSAVKAAMEAEVEMARFDATMKTIPNSTDQARKAILDAAQAATKLAFDDEEAANSMATLFQRTGDVNEAIKLNGLAMDLARAKSIPLADATRMIGMVMSGNGRALKEYGIEIDDTLPPLEALGQLQEKVAGQSEAFAGTFQGKLDSAKVAFSNLKEVVGERLLPVITKLAESITKFATETLPEFIQKLKDAWEWLKEHELVMFMVAGAIAGLLVPALISMAVTIWTSVIPAFAALVVTMAPFLIGGAIIGGLVAGIVWVVKNWEKVGERFKIIWDGIKSAFKDSINFLIGLAEGMANMYVKAVNTIISALNKIKFSIPSWVPGVGGKSFGIEIPLAQEMKLPRLEHGGIVNGPRGTEVPVMAHGQERIIPANQSGSNGGGNTYQVIINNPQILNQQQSEFFREQIEIALRDVTRSHRLTTI